jgi:uncharacterized heparinase superfamily protein
MIEKLRRYYHTLRPLRFVQTGGRVWAAAKARAGLIRLPPAPDALQGKLEAHVAFVRHAPGLQREDVLAGRFCFLNRELDLGRPVRWTAEVVPLLWRYNLHYGQWLQVLEPPEQESLCREWVTANPPGRTVGWLPYPNSLRIVNWCKAGFTSPDLLASLYAQTAWLYRTTEYHQPGNHLLENARALVFAGRFFARQGEADHWLQEGLKILERETPIQVLPDGGHFERSPMYHALMLELYLDMLNVLPREHPACNVLTDATRRMADFLASVLHPDERIPLFNDATFEIAPSPTALISYARRLIGHEPILQSAFPDTGLYLHRDERAFLVIDGGLVGPDYLLAHAHADIFSYELSVGGQRFIVDTGVFEYPAGEMRRYVRSTKAHNTVCVDDTDQAECWGSFRVARRFAPHSMQFYSDNSGTRLSGCFDGYGSLIGDGIRHQRTVEAGCGRMRIEDHVTGRGTHRVESRIHLHPEVTCTLDGPQARLTRNGVQCLFRTGDNSQLRTENGWYCPGFGVRHRNQVLVLGGLVSLPASLQYSIECAD